MNTATSYVGNRRVVAAIVMTSVLLVAHACGEAGKDPGVSVGLDAEAIEDLYSPSIDIPTNSQTDNTDNTDGGDSTDAADGSDGADGTEPPKPVDCKVNTSADTCPCSDHNDCDSGYCLLTSKGKACAQFCSDECPSGFSCQGVGTAGAGADLSFLCVERGVYLCRPCMDNSDCAALGFEGLDKCVSYGDQGSFCGIACNLDNPCPLGFECDGGQCVAAGGTCKCAPLHITIGASTECYTTTSDGSCKGTRACMGAGLSQCDAKAPQQEVCDGSDNNCSGFIDDIPPTECELPNDFGVCKGTLTCIAGEGVCEGVKASVEVCDGKDNDCNGVVDDGFPNHDDDALPDCVDPDDDNDGLVDENDNCPIHPNPDQTNSDDDEQGDACDQDDDNDGANDIKDCEPTLPYVYPFAEEKCDGIDNDCDNVVDEKSCDDGNDCTDDVCTPAIGCEHPYNTAPCNDGNQCTQNDACWLGGCTGQFVDCDDSNPCTNDSCDPKLGCIKTNNVLPCDDGNQCTVDDNCAGGTCLAGSLLQCVDGNSCTLDACDAKLGCTFTFLDNLCDDGNPCTVSDKCTSGTCVGLEKVCDDANPCTKDYCSPAVDGGCVNLAQTGGNCEDGLPCTINDKCVSGVCQGIDLNCECLSDNDCKDDGNMCNGVVFCDKLTVPFTCKKKPNSEITCGIPAEYDEGCATSICDPKTGQCSPKLSANGKKCDDGDACTSSDVCESGLCAGQGKSCDDGNPCTIDACDDLKGCEYTVVAGFKACDDGDPCTAGDGCEFGFCVSKGSTDCDDGNPCTDDSCNPASGCKNKPNIKPCIDADLCTENETCIGGKCVGSQIQCTDNNKCFGSPKCEPAKGCVQGAAISCDDGIPCTLDKCVPTTGCQNIPDDTKCDDGGFCNGLETCVPGKGCQTQALANGTKCNDGNACTLNDVCVGGTCKGDTVNCDDKNACTNDSCDPVAQGCVNEVIVGFKACDDGDVCTATDLCQGGFCVGTGVNTCDDKNPCTTDSCDPVKGCLNIPTAGACDDGDECTLADACNAGKCVGKPLDCSGDGDGDACTINDKCVKGACVGTPKDCSSLTSECGEGACVDGTCVANPIPGDCDDNDACTINDVCSAGQCIGVQKDCSSLDATCAVGVCEQGQCVEKVTPCNATQFKFITPSVSCVMSAQGQHSTVGSAGQSSPSGASNSVNGHSIIWGFHALSVKK